MSSTTNNYFLNVNTYFRDINKYPNPCDFGINFSRFDATGTFVQGLPENVNSLFQQISIDPDYLDNNLQFVNATINQQSRTTTTLLVSGLFDFTLDFKINYLNTNIYIQTGTSYTGAVSETGVLRNIKMNVPYICSFNVDINANNPYTFNWIFYCKPSRIPEIFFNISNKATFQVSQNGNIYFLFDFSMRQFDFILNKNNQTTILTSVTNPTVPNDFKDYLGGNYGRICLCLTYIDKDGDVGIVNNHAYGYHLFYGDSSIIQTANNGNFSITSDFADNTYISFVYNPLHRMFDNVSNPANVITDGQPFVPGYLYQTEEDFYFINSTGPVYLGYNNLAFAATVTNFYTGPYRCWFLQESSGPYMNLTYITPLTGASKTSVASAVNFTGASNEIFYWISSVDQTEDIINPTGSNIFKIDPTSFEMTFVTLIPSTGAASCAMAKNGGNTYLFNTNIYNWMDVYSYNTSTFIATRITGIQIPTTYIFLRQVFTIIDGTNIYIFSLPRWPGFDPATYNSNASKPAFVFLFDTSTNIITLISTFTYYNSNSFLDESLSIRTDKIYLISGAVGQNKILFYDITDPYNVFIRSELQANSVLGHTNWTYTENGMKRYYMHTTLFGTAFNKFYDITDLDNILELSDSNYYIKGDDIFTGYQIMNGKFNSFIDFSGYGTLSRLDNPYLFFDRIPLPTSQIEIKSIHYNQNLQRTISLAIPANCCVTFNYNNQSYVVFASNSAIQIYQITSLRSSLLISTIPLGLPTIMYDLIFIYHNNTLNFLACGLGYVFSFILLPNLLSIVPTGLFTSVPDAYSEARFFQNNGILYAIVVSYTSRIYRFMFNPALTITGFSLINPPFLPAIVALYFDIVTLTYCLFLTTTNLTNFADLNLFYNVTTGINLVTTFLRNPGFIPRSASQVLTDPRTGLTYAGGYLNIAVGTYELQSFTAISATRNFSSVDLPTHINGKTQLYYTDRPYLVTNIFGGTGSNGDYINVYDLNDIQYPIMVFDTNVNIVGTGASPSSPNFIVDMKVNQFNDRTTLVCLNSNNTFYLYDLSNPNFAGFTQNLKTVTDIRSFSFCPSYSFIYKLDSEGNTKLCLSARSEFTSTGSNGCQINISNAKISSDNINLYVSGGFTDKIQLFNSNSNSPSNQIFYQVSSYDGFIAKCNIITGNWDWIIPIQSVGNDFIQKIQYVSSINSIVFSGYTTSGNIVLFNPQNAGTLTNPIIPQYNVVGSSNTTNGFLFLLDNKGVYKWSCSIYTNDNLREVLLQDIGIENNKIVVCGLSNANNINCIDSSGKNTQNLYTLVEDSTQKAIINYYFDTSGIYQKSQYVLLPYSTQSVISDIKIYNELNQISFTPIIYYKNSLTTSYYNKDGTLAHTDTGLLNTITSYLVNYLNDSSFTDTNGKQYSYVKLINPPNYPFTGSFFQNYNLYIGPATDQTYLNQNFSVRTNLTISTGDYRFVLNNKIDTSKIDRLLFPINNITGSENYYSCNLSSSPLVNIFEYNISQMPTIDNTITSIGLVTELDDTIQYYISIVKYNQFFSYPIENITIDTNGDYVFQLQNVNDLRISTGGSFYGPYLYLTQFNQNVFYNLQFYPSSLNTPVYYSIQLNSLVLPNRPLRQNPKNYIKTLTDMPYIYVAIYSVDDEDLADQEIVNIVYDNNPNREKIEIFQLNTVNAGDTSNFVTYTSSTVPKVKFNSNFTTLRIKIFDPYGKILLFDNTPYKSSDSTYIGGVIPNQLMNISIQFTLIKKF
jgi:hypothetical protein